MKLFKAMIITTGLGLALTSCGSKTGDPDFKYSIDEFADIEVLRYQVPGWEDLSLQQKEYIYHLSEAAKSGRDITWDQNFKYNLEIRHALEAIIEHSAAKEHGTEWEAFLVYAKRVFFSNGIHHHYANDKILPACSRDYFASLMDGAGIDPGRAAFLLQVIYDPELYPTLQYQGTEKDLVEASAVNFYEGVTAREVNDFYARMEDPSDPHPISYGLNSKVVKENGKVVEKTWKVGGIYGPALEVIIGHLEAAKAVAENDTQKQYIDELIAYYRSGDLRMWDKYNITWVGDTESDVDFVNGFVEDYDDPLGRKASWEGIVNYRDREASKRTEIISRNAQWFEDNSPVDPRFKKEEVKGVSAKVINVAVIAGDNYPATAIGINLPNADWIRAEHGSKSVTIGNITEAYKCAAKGNGFNDEFVIDQETLDCIDAYGDICDELHTDLHECLGHGSGQLLEGVSPDALKAYADIIEEARADLYGLYYIADRKLVNLGLVPDETAYKSQYYTYFMNGLMTQLTRIKPGHQIEEAHMRNRALICHWCMERGSKENVVEMPVVDGKTYVRINDYGRLRELIAELLAEVQRIKSDGDYQAAHDMVEQYAVSVDPGLHQEVLSRYEKLHLAPYKGFVNPILKPVVDEQGRIIDVKADYSEGYTEQMLRYSRDYSTLI